MPSFDELMIACGSAACHEWNYPPTTDDWLSTLTARLPLGLQQAIAAAVDDGAMTIVNGHQFTLSGLAPGKGPYSLFSRSKREIPAPNWEYFVQIAEYRRVATAVEARGLRANFEDDLMDISVYASDRVIWCIEVKEKARDLRPLLLGIRTGSTQVDMTGSDRHNDPLRKSKYLMRHRPPYFSLVAIGQRLDFSVTYSGDGFVLTEDLVPLG